MANSINTYIVQTFDSFCKTVIRNESRNIQKQYNRLRKHQLSLSELPESIIEAFQVHDHSIENSEVFPVYGIKILVSDLFLSEAISKLDDLQRIIILLFYFVGFNDREVSRIIGMSVSGTWYQRRKAEKKLKVKLEEMNYDSDL